eukprot:Gb_37484 [translate_table: standard]
MHLLHTLRLRLWWPLWVHFVHNFSRNIELIRTSRDARSEAFRRVIINSWRTINISTPLMLLQNRILVTNFIAFAQTVIPSISIIVTAFFAENPPWNLREGRVLVRAVIPAR